MSLRYRTPEVERRFLDDWTGDARMHVVVDTNGVLTQNPINEAIVNEYLWKRISAYTDYFRRNPGSYGSDIPRGLRKLVRETKGMMSDLQAKTFLDINKARIGMGQKPYKGLDDQQLGLLSKMARMMKDKPTEYLASPPVRQRLMELFDPLAPDVVSYLAERPKTTVGITSGGTEKRMLDEFKILGVDYTMGPKLAEEESLFTGEVEFVLEGREYAFKIPVTSDGIPDSFLKRVNRDRIENHLIETALKLEPAQTVLLIDDSEEGVRKKRYLQHVNQRRRHRGEAVFENIYLLEVDLPESLRGGNRLAREVDVIADELGDVLELSYAHERPVQMNWAIFDKPASAETV